MANITITADTTEKKIDVKVDGKAVDNVNYISLDTENSGYGFAVNISVVEEAGENLKKITHLVANEKGEIVESKVDEKEEEKKEKKKKAKADIAEYFAK